MYVIFSCFRPDSTFFLKGRVVKKMVALKNVSFHNLFWFEDKGGHSNSGSLRSKGSTNYILFQLKVLWNFRTWKNSFDKDVQKCTKLLVKETELVRIEKFYSVNCWANQKNEEKLRENFLWTRFLQVVGMRESIEWFLSLFTSNQNGTSYDLDGISFSWTLLRPSSSHQFLKFFRRSVIAIGATEKSTS